MFASNRSATHFILHLPWLVIALRVEDRGIHGSFHMRTLVLLPICQTNPFFSKSLGHVQLHDIGIGINYTLSPNLKSNMHFILEGKGQFQLNSTLSSLKKSYFLRPKKSVALYYSYPMFDHSSYLFFFIINIMLLDDKT